MTQINVCIVNKQMHDKQKDRLPLPLSKMIKMLKGQKKHIDKEQGKFKHEAPRSVNYRATQNKNNIGTTALERSVVYTTGGGGKGLKAFHCTNFTLGPDIILNTKIHKKFGSHNGFLLQSMHLSENVKSNRSL